MSERDQRLAELLPKLERLLTSIAAWRRGNKMKIMYSRPDPHTVAATPVGMNGSANGSAPA